MIDCGKPHVEGRRVDTTLEEMRECCDVIAGYLDGISEDEFRIDRMRQDAVIRRLEIIGEAAGRLMKLDRRFAETLPELPLREAYEMRNFISHGYDSVDLGIVWDTITHDIPALRSSLELVLERRRADLG